LPWSFTTHINIYHAKKNQMEKRLPKLADLHHDVNTAFKNDELNLLLNQPPNQKWLKNFPAEMGIKGGGQYLPIDKVEFLLTYIFQQWYVEVKEVQQLFQSVAVTIALYYKNPLTGEWCKTEGVGAAPVQTDKGASAANLGSIKNRAVQIALPIAKSAAIKDAAGHLGTLFGRDLNRKDTVMFSGAYDTAPEPQSNVSDRMPEELTKEMNLHQSTPSLTFNPSEL
jgi:hypothetical protein